MKQHPDYITKVAENHDSQNSDLALKKIVDDVVAKNRRKGIDFYKLYVQDESFSQALFDMIRRFANSSAI